MATNPLLQLNALGQSVWLDYIERELLDSGALERLTQRDGVSGVTSNPSIFAAAITGSAQYDAAIATLADAGATANDIYLNLVLDDIRRAADVLAPIHVASGGRDGYVSLEVSPHLADDTAGSIKQARWLWQQAGRPNVMIKIPGTRAGVAAIEALVREGINVNVTLLFSVDRYRDVADAYLRGLESRARAGLDLNVASVASFFLSRIDTAVETAIAAYPAAADLGGHIAIDSAKTAYAFFAELLAGDRWARLARRDARPQRLLWASTSTKNPAYSDVLYVDSLIGPETVNTLPPATLDAYRDHGQPRPTVTAGLSESRERLRRLAAMNVDLEAIARTLEADGVRQFAEAFDGLMAALDRQRRRSRSA